MVQEGALMKSDFALSKFEMFKACLDREVVLVCFDECSQKLCCTMDPSETDHLMLQTCLIILTANAVVKSPSGGPSKCTSDAGQKEHCNLCIQV